VEVDHADVGLAEDAPTGLASALAAREARVVDFRREHTRAYILAVSPGGRLFARYSSDPDYGRVLRHEATVRELIGAEGVLRAPPVLDQEESWMLEHGVDAAPCADEDCADTVAAAAARIAELDLPQAPPGPWVRRRLHVLERGIRLVRAPLPLADVTRARRVERRLELPLVMCHRDFHPGNVLVEGGAAWVVDWEGSGPHFLGYDLMQFWATVSPPEVRARILEAALDLVGSARRRELLQLRYALLVRTIFGKLSAPEESERDPEGAQDLLALLPGVRAEAGL
jgi:hypothetical protein